MLIAVVAEFISLLRPATADAAGLLIAEGGLGGAAGIAVTLFLLKKDRSAVPVPSAISKL